MFRFEAVAMIDENNAIANSNSNCGLYELNLKSGIVKFVQMIPNEKVFGRRLYTTAVRSGSKVYFIPYSAKEICVFNIENRSIDKIPFIHPLETNRNYDERNSFGGAVIYGKYVFMAPSTYPGVVRIDTTNDVLEYYDTWMDGSDYLFRKDLVVCNDSFFVPSSKNNLVLEFCMNTCEGKFHHVGEKNTGCWGICKSGDAFWMSPANDGPIVRWNYADNSVDEYDYYLKNWGEGKCGFSKTFCVDNKVYFLPTKENNGVVWDALTQNFELISIPELNNKSTSFMFQIDNQLYLFIKKESCNFHICLNMEDGTVNPFELISDEAEKEFFSYYLNCKMKGQIVRESKFFQIDEFLKGM